jgi:four helix bundle protein
MAKIQSFKDLIVWQQAHELALLVYKATKKFPKEETYSLVDQMKRCVISIGSNIAEGFSRRGKKEKLQFYFTAKGSLTELQNQLLLAKDVGYLSKEEFELINEKTESVHRLLNAFIKSAETKYEAKY